MVLFVIVHRNFNSAFFFIQCGDSIIQQINHDSVDLLGVKIKFRQPLRRFIFKDNIFMCILKQDDRVGDNGVQIIKGEGCYRHPGIT